MNVLYEEYSIILLLCLYLNDLVLRSLRSVIGQCALLKYKYGTNHHLTPD
jgi:hypothetical protein